MSTGHHTCCCQCSGVETGGELLSGLYGSNPLTTTFAAGVNQEGAGSVIRQVCTCVVQGALTVDCVYL